MNKHLSLAFLATVICAAASTEVQPPPKVENFQLDGERWICTADGKPLSGVLLKPEGNGPFPAIVLSHGLGGNAQAMMTVKGREMVHWGFVCITTDYTHAGKGGGRPAGGRGRFAGVDFTQAGARSENIRRALACLEILRQQKDVYSRRIAAYGHSMGAFVTIALAAAASDKLAVAAITAGGVVTDQYRTASAPSTNVAAQVRVPFLILQGSADTTVTPESSERLKQVLDGNKVPNDRRVFDGVGHSLPVERAEEVNRLMREWFTNHGVLASAKKQETQTRKSLPTADGAASEWVTPPATAPRLQQRTFDSAAAKAKVSYHIYTPEVYDLEKERRFPVLYWLHGSGGGLPGAPQLVAHFDTAIRAGKTPPMLVVFVNGLRNGMWCDSKDGKRPVETIVMKELLPHIDATFRTIAVREGRLIEGFSMGGYGAARLGFKYHEVFCAISMLGGGPLQPDFRETPRVGPQGREQILQDAFGGDMEYFKAQSPWVLAEQNAAALRGKMPIRQVIGDRDETCAFNRDFHERLVKLEIPHTFTVLPGIGHKPLAVLEALGEANWKFYRAAFGKGSKP